MNNAMIRYILGQVLRIEGILMLLPCIVAVIYREKEGFVILGVAALCFFLGTLATIRKPKSHVFYLKEGCVATALSWIIMSIFGSLPFYLTGTARLLWTPCLRRSPVLRPPAPAS